MTPAMMRGRQGTRIEMGVGVDPEGGVGVGAAHGEGAGVKAEGETPEAG